MKKQFACTDFVSQNGIIHCANWQEIPNYSTFKLTYAEMGSFIVAIAFLFGTVAVFKWVRRAL